MRLDKFINEAFHDESIAALIFGKNNYDDISNGNYQAITVTEKGFGKIVSKAKSLGFKFQKRLKPASNEPYNEIDLYISKEGTLRMSAIGRANIQNKINYTFNAVYIPREK